MNIDAITDFLVNSYPDSEDPIADLVEVGEIDVRLAKKILAAWQKIDILTRHKMGFKEKDMTQWVTIVAGKNESLGRVKALKEATLNKDDLENVETEVTSSYTEKEIKDFKDFDDFFAAIERQNAMDSEIPWKPKKWKPYFQAVYNKLK